MDKTETLITIAIVKKISMKMMMEFVFLGKIALIIVNLVTVTENVYSVKLVVS